MHSLDPNSTFDSSIFLKALDESLAGVGRRRQAGVLRYRYYFDKSWRRAYETVHSFVDQQVQRALAETTAGENSGSQNPKAQTGYILLNEMAKEICDPIELRYEIIGVFLPARDTSSIQVGNSLFHLSRNPQVWLDLRKSSMALGSTPLTFETLKSLVDFRNVLHETLRVQGPSGRTLRQASCDTVLPVGGGDDGKSPIAVQKGTIVALNFWGSHHDPDTWGEDADKFVPSRWIGKRPLWEFVPFLGGPRICPAQQQVLTHAVYILVRLTRRFARIENRDPAEEYVEFTKMTTQSRNGVKIALFEE